MTPNDIVYIEMKKVVRAMKRLKGRARSYELFYYIPLEEYEKLCERIVKRMKWWDF